MTKLRGYFFSGLIILLPLGATLIIFGWLITIVDRIAQIILPDEFIGERLSNIPGFSIFIVLIFIILIGAIGRGFVGRIYRNRIEKLYSKIPGLSNIYSTTKQITETIVSSSSKSFKEPVIIEYPRKGIYALAFITNEIPKGGKLKTKTSAYTVFLPTTPNPTSGFLLLIPKKEIIKIDLTVDEAIKFIISGGIIKPNDIKKLIKKKKRLK
ncbi:MAG: hypothetical protein CFH22_00826 [Alphaproteobacteria bacterium MarineAlpha5_Bin12]|nr:hypothetical protein [Pelagibacteraceae bacterium]PPR41412.1 MAG: hypothetical protein CFH22_00826 [Alphaproteobacteria bacterium MarineAlpha5_Bin12]|tara:strand:+ start:578 stop:1210 length:633 start_codon:yes stop_codon:yes gene_type:complete